MKKSAKLKRKTVRMIVKNLIVFAVLIVVAAIGVRSWFTSGSAKAGASGIDVTCQVPDGLEVAIVAPNADIVTTGDTPTVWYDSDFSITSENYPFIGSLSFTEITGDGKTFVKPKIVQYGSVAMADTSKANEWVAATANDEYLSFDMYLRTRSSSANVLMTTNSYYGPDSYTQTFGDSLNGWSPHTVIGAARMSVVDPTVTSTTRSAWQKLLWIPAPFLEFDPITRNGDAQLLTDITDTSNTYGLTYYDESNNVHTPNPDGTYNHGYYLVNAGTAAVHGKVAYSDSADDAATSVTANTSLDADNTATDNAKKRYHLPYDVKIAQIGSTDNVTYKDANNKDVTYYQKKVRVNMWIEGEDPESRSAQVSGTFKAILSLKIGN